MRPHLWLLLTLSLVPDVIPGPWAQGRGGPGRSAPIQEPEEDEEREPAENPDFGTPRLEGVPGSRSPQPTDIRSEDEPIHPPGDGVARHALLDVAESDGAGLLLTWRDTRDGVPTVRFGRLSPRVRLREPERRVSVEALEGPETAPVPVLGSGGHMMLLRVERTPEGAHLRVRGFSPDGSRLEEFDLLAPTPAEDSNPKQGPRSASPRSPRKAKPGPSPTTGPPRGPVGVLDPFGGGWVAWRQGSVAWLQQLSGPLTPAGEPRAVPLIDPEDPRWRDAEFGSLCLERAPSGRALMGWSCNGRVHLLGIPREGDPRSVEGGEGELLAIHCLDASGTPGWWLELEVDERRVLRPLDRGLSPSAEDLVLPDPLRSLAVWEGGLVLLLGETPWVHRYSWTGRPLPREPLRVLPEDAGATEGLRLAGGGDRLFALWTEVRGGHRDVFARSLQKWGEGWSAAARVSTDVGTGDQHLADVATDGQRRVLAVWVDEGGPGTRVQGRAWRIPGSPGDAVFGLPRAMPDPPNPEGGIPGVVDSVGEIGTRPRVALDSGGHALVVWLSRAAEGEPFRVAGQLLDAAGEALAPARYLDHPEALAVGDTTPAVVPFASGRGFAVSWVRESGEVVVRHVNRQGKPAQREYVLDRGSSPRNPDLVQLEDLRWIVAWDDGPLVGGRSIRARFLGVDLRPIDTAFLIEQLDTGVDARPSLAPAPGGGFALAWVSGRGPDRDVFARTFDDRGRAATKPMPVTTTLGAQDRPDLLRTRDGSWVVAWEDDLSGAWQVNLRRLDPGSFLPGPVVSLHQQGPALNPNRGQPRLANIGPALLGVWIDHRLSQGHDVFHRLLGPDFDAIEVEPPSGLEGTGEDVEVGDGG